MRQSSGCIAVIQCGIHDTTIKKQEQQEVQGKCNTNNSLTKKLQNKEEDESFQRKLICQWPESNSVASE